MARRVSLILERSVDVVTDPETDPEDVHMPNCNATFEKRAATSPCTAVFLAILTLSQTVETPPVSAQEIFSDSFDDGTVARWSVVQPLPCAGSPPSSSLEGDLGAAPPAPYRRVACLEVRNDLDLQRTEVAHSAIPLPLALDARDLDRLVLVSGGRRVAAQFAALSRWGAPLSDAGQPVRWLSVALTASLSPESSNLYELRLQDETVLASDPWAVTTTTSGATSWTVSTGAATFSVDSTLPGILSSIDLEPVAGDLSAPLRISSHTASSGPRFVLDRPTGDLTLDGGSPASWELDSFEWVEIGPVRATLMASGHLMDPAGSTLCTANSPSYEPLGYTVALTFARASRNVLIDLEMRNECSDGFGSDWTDDTVRIHEASWTVSLSQVGSPGYTVVSGLGTALSSSSSGFLGHTLVEQAKGAGNPWTRRARVLRDGIAIQQAVVAPQPVIALATDEVAIAALLPWLRFREPQGLASSDRDLSLLLVSDGESSAPLILGEGKGLRARGLLSPAAVSGSADDTVVALRDRGLAQLERGLLVRADLESFNRSRILPSLGTNRPSPLRDTYQDVLETLHAQTLQNQWSEHKTYGSQLWPDNQFGQWPATIPSPAQNSGAHNYWNPNGVELLELLRTGDPQWAWDMALAQSWLQLFTAYLNVGDQRNSNRSGAAVTSGGSGEGQWHRSAFGSDDYTYNRGLHLAYAVRPSPLVRKRFTQQGQMVLDRYSVPWADQGLRDFWTQRVSPERGILQHFENLANCAEFSPGANGALCHSHLLDLLEELVADNFAAGIFCQGDAPSPTVCSQPQQFMQAAMMHGFFTRMLYNYGHIGHPLSSGLRALLTTSARVYYEQGMSHLAGGPDIDVAGPWAALLECGLTGGGTGVGICTWLANSDGTNLLETNKPQSLAALFVAHELDPSVELCPVASQALESPWLLQRWSNYFGNGWWKGSSQMMQDAVFALGGYETCRSP